MFNSIHKFTLLVGLTAGLLSCGDDHNDTGTEFAPNMYNSVGYEPMTQLAGDTNTINPLGINMRVPVAGTISRKKYTGADSLKKAFLAQELAAKTVPNDSLNYSAAILKSLILK